MVSYPVFLFNTAKVPKLKLFVFVHHSFSIFLIFIRDVQTITLFSKFTFEIRFIPPHPGRKKFLGAVAIFIFDTEQSVKLPLFKSQVRSLMSIFTSFSLLNPAPEKRLQIPPEQFGRPMPRPLDHLLRLDHIRRDLPPEIRRCQFLIQNGFKRLLKLCQRKCLRHQIKNYRPIRFRQTAQR